MINNKELDKMIRETNILEQVLVTLQLRESVDYIIERLNILSDATDSDMLTDIINTSMVLVKTRGVTEDVIQVVEHTLNLLRLCIKDYSKIAMMEAMSSGEPLFTVTQ